MHTTEEPEEPGTRATNYSPGLTSEDLDYLDSLVALDCRSTSISVQEEGLWRCRSLSEDTHTHVVGIRIARLRAYWSATGRELHRLSEVKRSVV